MASISEFFDELRRRNVFRVAALYVIAAWMSLQVADLALGSWGLSADWLRYVWVVALIGFPLSIIFGWTYDIKNGHIVRTRSANAGDKSDLSLRRTDYMLLGAMAIVLFAVVYGAVRQAQLENSINAADRVSASVSTWAEADMMFRRQANWLGGDSSVSVELGGGRILWLFGDSFVASVTGQSRAESTMVSNTIAIQQGYDPSSAALRYYWRTNEAGPASFFSEISQEEDNQKYWPSSALLIERSLIIFFVEIVASDEGLGFEHTGTTAVIIKNPQDSPELWIHQEVPVPPNEMGILVGYSNTISVDGHAYAFSMQDSTKDIYLARWSNQGISSGSLDAFEWWSGDRYGWLAAEDSDERMRPVMSDTPTPFSVHYDQRLEKFVLLQTWGFGGAVVAVRTAKQLTGPWSDRQIIHRPQESNRPGAMIYGGVGHIHLDGADIVATYNVNNAVFSELISDQSIYYPRFIRIDVER